MKLSNNFNANATASYHRRYLPHPYVPTQHLDDPVPIGTFPSVTVQAVTTTPIPNSSSSSSAFVNVAQSMMDSFSKRRQKSRSYRSQTLKKILFHNNESPL